MEETDGPKKDLSLTGVQLNKPLKSGVIWEETNQDTVIKIWNSDQTSQKELNRPSTTSKLEKSIKSTFLLLLELVLKITLSEFGWMEKELELMLSLMESWNGTIKMENSSSKPPKYPEMSSKSKTQPQTEDKTPLELFLIMSPSLHVDAHLVSKMLKNMIWVLKPVKNNT